MILYVLTIHAMVGTRTTATKQYNKCDEIKTYTKSGQLLGRRRTWIKTDLMIVIVMMNNTVMHH